MWKILVLPELYEKVNTWWPFSVVYNLHKNDTKKVFSFIKKKWTIERCPPISQALLKRILRKIWCIYLVFFFKRILSIFFQYIYKKEKQGNILCHDTFMSFCYLFFGKVDKLTFVYHGQWSSYNEVRNLSWAGKSFVLKKFLDAIEHYVFTNAHSLWFPSLWAYESLLKTTSRKTAWILKQRFKKQEVHILHNGININQKSLRNKLFLKGENNENEITFTTVSTLNYEKWVDRIPHLIKHLLDSNINLKWIIVWNGKMLEKIKQDISVLGIKKHVLLFSQPFKKEEIIYLLKNSDIYIMLHRISIFDYATLEAMCEWVVPLLSNVWWNKEVNIKENCLLIDPDELEKHHFQWITDKIKQLNLKKLKETNKQVILENFTEQHFINSYYKALWIH